MCVRVDMTIRVCVCVCVHLQVNIYQSVCFLCVCVHVCMFIHVLPACIRFNCIKQK